MNQREFDRISRPERDALDYIRRRVGTMAHIREGAVLMMAAQVADFIRSNSPTCMESPEGEDQYRSAVKSATDQWDEYVFSDRTQTENPAVD